MRLMSIPASGNSPPVSLLTLTNEVDGLDIGPDGSIFLDQVERPPELLRFPASGGHVEKIADLTTVPVAAEVSRCCQTAAPLRRRLPPDERG